MFALTDHRLQITQQQRNNKRQRASSQQLRVLHQFFKTNPKPNSWIRQQIGRQIDMTPRSVQIWFQNKRAKQKKAVGGYYGHFTAQRPSRHLLNCSSLKVAGWVRVFDSARPDLWVKLDLALGMLTYTISHGSLLYRVGIPFNVIKSVELLQQGPADAATSGCLRVAVGNTSLVVFGVSSDRATWTECTDFTGGEIFRADQHRIYGKYEELLIQASGLIFR